MTGLLDEEGAKIASYTYDAWGNVITDTEKSFCYEGYEVPFELNHVLYRGYYYDGSCTDTESDTNLYYLQSRYYDAEVGRFVNADDVNVLGVETASIFKDNMYIYCNSNPIMYTDPSGCIAIADDIVFLGIAVLAIGVVMYASYTSTYQFRYYSQSFYREIQKALSQTWNRITILFKSASQVVNKAIEKILPRSETL